MKLIPKLSGRKTRYWIAGSLFGFLLAAVTYSYGQANGWGVPSVIGKAITFLLPATGQVTFDCDTTDLTTTTGCVNMDVGSGTASALGNYCTFNQTADVNGQSCYGATFDTVTALTGTNVRGNYIALPRGHASDASTAVSAGYVASSPAVASGGQDTAVLVLSGYEQALNATSGDVTIASDANFVMGGVGQASTSSALQYDTTQTNDSTIFGLDIGSRTLIVADYADMGFNFAHSNQSNPTVFIHSNNQSTTQWLSLTHDSTNGVVSVGTGEFVVAAHLSSSGTAPTPSSCGTGPAITGHDTAGKVTTGTGAPTGCVLTFASAFANAPACTVTSDSGAFAVSAVSSTTALTITCSAACQSDVIMYICVGL